MFDCPPQMWGMRMCFMGPHWNMTFCPWLLTLLSIVLFGAFAMPNHEWCAALFGGIRARVRAWSMFQPELGSGS